MTEEERQRLARIRSNLEKRALVIKLVRQFFDQQGFLEVDTPTRTPAVAPEKEIIPLGSEGWFLSTSPELYMKRLLAAGYEKIYQISHCFRKAERGRLHNPEFSLLEWYRDGATYEVMVSDTEHLIQAVAAGLGTSEKLQYRGRTIDLSLPWGRCSLRDLYRQHAEWDPVSHPDARRFDEDMVLKIIPCLNPHRPTVMKDYPAPMASLARLKSGQQNIAERAEIFIGGLELANMYSELISPAEQEERFRKEAEEIKAAQGRTAPLPEKFLAAMKYLPDCAGNALGLDRLVMLFCDAASIDEVMPFPEDMA